MIQDHGTYIYDGRTGLYWLADRSFKSLVKQEVVAKVSMQTLEMLDKPTPLPIDAGQPDINNEKLWQRYSIGQLVPCPIELVNILKYLPLAAIVLIRPPVRQVTYAPPEFGVLFEGDFVCPAYMLDHLIGDYMGMLAAYHTESIALGEAVKTAYDESSVAGVTVEYYREAWRKVRRESR